MDYFWFLKLGFKCIDRLAWPLLTLGYPMCASIQAIENDSHADTKNLISYWILLSLIYLFEYAFGKLLEWILLWPYFKLAIIFWLVIPDFRRSFLVYGHFVHPCISMNPRGIISRIENWKKLFAKKESILLQAEEYIKENGTEALEKLISSKNMKPNLDKEITTVQATGKKQKQQNMASSIEEEAIIKAVPGIEKKVLTRNLMHSLGAEAYKEVPMTEKKHLPQNMMPNLDKEITTVQATRKKQKQQNMASSIEEEAIIKEVPGMETKQTEQNLMHGLGAEAFKEVPMTEKKQLPQTSEKVLQIGQMYIKVTEKKEVPADKNANTTAPKLALNESESWGAVDANTMAGKDHIEQRYIKVVEKREVPADKNANPTTPNLALNQSKSSGEVDAYRTAGKGVEVVELHNGAASKKVSKEWTCALCQVTTTSEETLKIHVHGKKHMAALEALRWKAKIDHVNKVQKNPQS